MRLEVSQPDWRLFDESRLADTDPLLPLLQRYQVERQAFDNATVTEEMTDQDWDRLAQATWSRTQDQIIESEPPATTAAGALRALDHVLQSDDLFFERSESPDLQMLWLLVKAAARNAALASSRVSANAGWGRATAGACHIQLMGHQNYYWQGLPGTAGPKGEAAIEESYRRDCLNPKRPSA